MEQPNDTKTADIFAGEKRGRGRPKLDNAKSAAERARQYRLNKKTRPQVTRPLAAAADEIEFLRGQVEALSRDLHNAEICARFAEDSFDEHLAEILRLRSELDNRDASQNMSGDDVVRDLQRELNGANAVIKGLKDDRVLVDKRCADLAQQLGAALVKSDVSHKIVTKKAVVVKSDASRKKTRVATLEEWPYPANGM